MFQYIDIENRVVTSNFVLFTIRSYLSRLVTLCVMMRVPDRFFDLCIPYNKDEKILTAILDELVELGYRTIAIEQTFDFSKKNAEKRGAEVYPQPHDINQLRDSYKNKLKILQRLTIIYLDASITHSMIQSQNLKMFDLIAGQPKTDAALNHCCSTFNGDIITFDSTAGSRLLVSRKSYQVAVQRKLFFEIKYAPAIADSNNRKDIIKIAHNYCVKGKSKHIIFSSGATHKFQLRGPYDVASLSLIFGLSEDEGKNAIDLSCRQLFLRGVSRRLGKTIMLVKSNGPVVFSDTSDEELSNKRFKVA